MSDTSETPVQREPTTEDSPVRQHAKALWIQGMPRAQVAKTVNVQAGTLDKWAMRGDWKALRATIAPKGTLTITHQPQVFALRDRLAAKAAKLFEGLSEKCPKNPRDLKDVMAALAHAASAGNLIEGWSEGPKAFLDLAFITSAPEDVLACPQIDVTPEPIAPAIAEVNISTIVRNNDATPCPPAP